MYCRAACSLGDWSVSIFLATKGKDSSTMANSGVCHQGNALQHADGPDDEPARADGCSVLHAAWDAGAWGMELVQAAHVGRWKIMPRKVKGV